MRLKQILLGAATPAVLTVGGCVAIGPTAPPVTPAMVASAGSSAETLNLGRQIYSGRCTACHTADPVSKHTLTEWRGIVDDMAERSKLKADERTALLAYIAAARTVVPASSAAR